MRVGVVGAGAIGGAIAALLARGGHEVEVTARGDHLAAIRENGLRLTGEWGNYTAKIEAHQRLRTAAELVIVATKAQDASTAIVANARVTHGIPLLVVQNGLDGISAAAEAAPRADIVGGLATFASSYLSPGLVTITAAAPTYVGVAAGESDVPARYVAAVLDAVMPTTVLVDFAGAQWTKLVINQLNALPAITGLSVQEVVATPLLRRFLTASMRETVRLGLTLGIRFGSLQKLDHRTLSTFARLPLRLGQALPIAMAKRMGAVPNPGSTLQSVRRGQPTEIDYLNGAVVRAAAGIGRGAPINARLVYLVHLVEQTGTFVPVDEVVAH